MTEVASGGYIGANDEIMMVGSIVDCGQMEEGQRWETINSLIINQTIV